MNPKGINIRVVTLPLSLTRNGCDSGTSTRISGAPDNWAGVKRRMVSPTEWSSFSSDCKTNKTLFWCTNVNVMKLLVLKRDHAGRTDTYSSRQFSWPLDPSRPIPRPSARVRPRLEWGTWCEHPSGNIAIRGWAGLSLYRKTRAGKPPGWRRKCL